jgi:diguanylate cyclase (GGDEF)-like protein
LSATRLTQQAPRTGPHPAPRDRFVGAALGSRRAWADWAGRRRWLKTLRRDPITLLSAAIALSVGAMLLLDGPADPRPALLLTAAFINLELVLSRLPSTSVVIVGARFSAALLFVPFAGATIDPNGGWPLNALMIPTIALAAATWSRGLRFAAGVIATILVIAFLPTGGSPELSRRLVALAMASGVTAIGSRQVVESLAKSRDRLRRAQVLQRRRARQLAAVEAVGRTLAHEGQTANALDTVVGLLFETFGYRYPSIWTWDGAALRLGAQRNYAAPIDELPIDRGVVGRVARTRQAAFLPDARADPDYVAADDVVAGEIGVPLVAAGDLLGVLNVEVGPARRLDGDDFATMQIVGDRLAAALALGRERQKLAERARLMNELALFSRSLGQSLDPETIHAQVAAGACRVIRADMVVLALLDRLTGEFRVIQVEGGDPGLLGVRILPGEGITGRAIATASVQADDRLERTSYPQGTVLASIPDVLAAVGAPLVTDSGVVGALSWFREDLTRPFSAQEREVAGLVGSQAALAIANADLHHATELAAVTDALTGLKNRRFFDAALARDEAARRREPEDARRPRSAVIFDLDHFGQVNKLHGHQVGDRILRAFAEVVQRRVRASDLVARYGGEEFVVILEGATLGDAVRLADEIRESFADVRFALPDGTAVGCTVSAGCSALAPSETAATLLLERADVGLAMAKGSGRNRVVAA